MNYNLMDVNDAKRQRRRNQRRSKGAGPCSCPQCLMAVDRADDSFNLANLSDALMDVDDEDFDGDDLDDDFDDNNFDAADCNNEDLNDDDYDAKRRGRAKKRRQRSRGPCSCPQCLMAAELKDDQLDNFDDYDYGIADCNDEDLDDDNDYEVKRGRHKRRQRKSPRVPCGLMAADLETNEAYDDGDDYDEFIAMDDYDDQDDLDDDMDDEFIAMDDKDDYDDENDLDDEDYDDGDDYDEFIAMEDEDDYDDENDLDDEDYDDGDDYDEFIAMDGEDDYDDEAFDVRTVKVGCPGIKKVRVRKNQAGEEPFTSLQEQRLCSAVRLAYAEARNVAAALDQIWYQKGLGKMEKRRRAWRNNPAIVRWFGTKTLTRNQILVTRRRVKRILKFFERGITFVIVQHQTGKLSWLCEGSRAYAWGGSRVYLCPQFLQDGDLRARARTVIHELVHKIGWGHPRLRGRGYVSSTADHRDWALELAQRFPRRARRSPVNFAWLYNEF